MYNQEEKGILENWLKQRMHQRGLNQWLKICMR